ncbi:acyltransferase family protein [Nocardioides sp.]|uniref:acyltransferase family protein n=1 Tax=Nocardioides sp. TaxID=35761 RepID=UPI003D110A11
MKWSYRPALDGARALAVYLVLLFHSGMSIVGGGFVGVDLFFVLSGFLVTNVLLSEVDNTGSIRLGRFYARRVRRLLPAAVVVIVATAAMFVIVASVVRRLVFVADARSALLYYANWHFLGQSNDYFATTVDRSPYLHFWSLSIEEQFYLFFPMVLLGLIWLSRRRGWALPVGLGVLAVLSVGSQLYWMSADPNHAYYGTDARLYQLLAGALLAVVIRSGVTARLATWMAPVGLALTLFAASNLFDVVPTWRGFLITVAGALLITGLMGERGLVPRMFARPVPVYLGKISYGTYLWHWPVLLILQELFELRPLVLSIIGAALSTGLAALSYEVFEMPLRRREGPRRIQWPVAISGVTVSALVAVLIIPPLLESDRKPALAAPEFAASGAAGAGTAKDRVPGDIDFAAAAGDIGSQRTCTTAADCFLVKGDGPTILLVGDSHARMLSPAFRRLAKDKGFSLAVNIATGCPWQAGVINDNRPPEQRDACVEQRGDWYDEVLPEIKPDLVVLVEQSYDGNDEKFESTLSRIGGSDESLNQLLYNTTRETLDTFSDLGVRTLVVKNTLKADGSPLDCLATAKFISQCAVPVPLGVDASDGFYSTEDVLRDDMFTVDINPVFCPDAPLCRPILNDVVVWRDYNHLTAEIGIHRRQKLWGQIEDTGALAGLGFDGVS